MKAGRDLSQIATQLKEEREAKLDYIVDTRSLEMRDDSSLLMAQRDRTDSDGYRQYAPHKVLQVTDHMHQQIAGQTGISSAYYRRMRSEAPELLARNVNHWFAEEPKTRMVRTLHGDARAFLSDSYRPLDNAELAEVALPLLQARGAQVRSSEITDARFYLKATVGEMQRATKVGDVVSMGVTISNSEIGAGSLQIYPFLETLACTNGMTVTTRDGEHDWSLTRRHIGSKQGGSDNGNAIQYISSEARAAEDKAFFLLARDTIAGVLSDDVFASIVDRIDAAADRPIERPIQQVVEVARERLGLRESEGDSVLDHLARGGQMNAWGLSSAITRTAEDVESYDRASELEKLGWKVIELPQTEWRTLAQAA